MVVCFTVSLGILIIISFQLYVLLFRYVTNISIYSLTHVILSLCLKTIARVVIEMLQIKVLLSTVTVQDLLPSWRVVTTL